MRLSVTSLSKVTSSDTLFNSLRGQAGASRAHKRIRISRIASAWQSLCQSLCKSMFSQLNNINKLNWRKIGLE